MITCAGCGATCLDDGTCVDCLRSDLAEARDVIDELEDELIERADDQESLRDERQIALEALDEIAGDGSFIFSVNCAICAGVARAAREKIRARRGLVALLNFLEAAFC